MKNCIICKYLEIFEEENSHVTLKLFIEMDCLRKTSRFLKNVYSILTVKNEKNTLNLHDLQ